MDHAKHDSVDAVVACVATLTRSQKNVIDVPWKRRGVDREKVQKILDGRGTKLLRRVDVDPAIVPETLDGRGTKRRRVDVEIIDGRADDCAWKY